MLECTREIEEEKRERVRKREGMRMKHAPTRDEKSQSDRERKREIHRIGERLVLFMHAPAHINES